MKYKQQTIQKVEGIHSRVTFLKRGLETKSITVEQMMAQLIQLEKSFDWLEERLNNESDE